MIYNNVNGIGWTFLKVSPKCVIVQLRHSESARVKGNWMNFIIFINNGEDCSESIVQGISFHDELSIGNPMSEDRCRGKCFLERVESILTEGVELPRNVLPGEVYQWNDNV